MPLISNPIVVLKNLKTEKTLLNTIKARKLKFFGHIKSHYSIMKNILDGKMEGRRPPLAHSSATTSRSGQGTA